MQEIQKTERETEMKLLFILFGSLCFIAWLWVTPVSQMTTGKFYFRFGIMLWLCAIGHGQEDLINKKV